jgi:subtilisin family serine protease
MLNMKKRAIRRKAKKIKAVLPDRVFSEVSPVSPQGESLFDENEIVTAQTVDKFVSERSLVHAAMKRLREMGFEVLATNYITINIAGPPVLYENVFKTTLTTVERPTIKHLGEKSTTTVIDTTDTDIEGLIDTSKSAIADLLEGGAINRKVYFLSSSYLPPSNSSYWNLDPPEVAVAMKADLAHRAGFTGRSIKVAMVDTGWYLHPYFTERGYRANPVVLSPGATNPDHDESGHGTGESANIFAIAPDVEFTMVKMSPVNPTADFNAAVSLRPDIISCSWGMDLVMQDGQTQLPPPLPAYLRPLEAAIAIAVRQGIVVVFSGGNGHFGFPGMHPDVISAGGAYMHRDGRKLEATQYASCFTSSIYQGRNVPDVCGLVGLPPKAIYLMLPVEPNDEIDRDLSAGGAYPNGDETTRNDGWAAFSGTSAAAPQLAGICALIKQACPNLSPSQIREILKRTARDVTLGRCSMRTGGNPAKSGHDLATGTGLADASEAVREARDLCT